VIEREYEAPVIVSGQPPASRLVYSGRADIGRKRLVAWAPFFGVSTREGSFNIRNKKFVELL
jgi:hypothetical protein